jgi:hypothetical protein
MASPKLLRSVRIRDKIGVYCFAWLLTLFATDPTLGLWSLTWMFPLGLFAFVAPEHRQAGGWTVIAIGWAIYLLHGLFYFRSRSLKATLLLLGILALIFLANIAGCRQMIHAH